MTTLLVGFDSAWTPKNEGSIVAVLGTRDGTFTELGRPAMVSFTLAEQLILGWQAEHSPSATIVLLDQPTIVKNAKGQRPVENIVASSVGRRLGGVQPSNTGRTNMFGTNAPVWHFLDRFGGPASPLAPLTDTQVFETYPVLTLIALNWTLPRDTQCKDRLPKYNPARTKSFLLDDWKYVCENTSRALAERGLAELSAWLDTAGRKSFPNKHDQDGVDACICLLVALYMIEPKECVMIGTQDAGYMVVPYGAELCTELESRCHQTGRRPAEWLHPFIYRNPMLSD